MNKLLANLNVLYVKLHNYHYNVVGSDFYAVHVEIEKEYEQFHEWIDEVAEQMKKDGEYPAARLKEYLELATIEEVASVDYRSKEIFAAITADYKELKVNIEEIRETEELSASKEGLLDDIESELDKKIWFFTATQK